MASNHTPQESSALGQIASAEHSKHADNVEGALDFEVREPEYEEYYSKYCPGPPHTEDLEMYTPGGLHPVDIGHTFQDRYEVVHKLGSGGSSTVWLARDRDSSRYVALKVISAVMSEHAESETRVQKELQQCLAQGSSDGLVVPVLDTFWIEGSNGGHLCLVQSVCGPSVVSFRREMTMKLRGDLVNAVCKQIAVGLSELHNHSLVYGDLSAGNVAFRVSNLDHLTTKELYDLFGEPDPYPTQPARETDTDWVKKHAPPAVYQNMDFMSDKAIKLIKPEICFIDFGASFFTPRAVEVESLQCTASYADPSSLWLGEDTSQASDCWALACILFELRSAICLFDDGPRGVPDAIEQCMGPVPQAWYEGDAEDGTAPEVTTLQDLEGETQPAALGSSRTKRDTLLFAFRKISSPSLIKQIYTKIVSWFSTSKVKEVNNPDPEPPTVVYVSRRFRQRGNDPTLHGQIVNIGNWHPWHRLTVEERRERLQAWNRDCDAAIDTSDAALDRGQPPPKALSPEEAADFEDLLKSLLTWDRKDRATVKNILGHPWLNKQYVEKQDDHWLQKYYYGCGYSSPDKTYI